MPIITDNLEQINLPGNHYGYSAVTNFNKLGASAYTLVQLIVDESGSVGPYQTEMEKCLQEVIQSCRLSPNADNLMVRLVTFSDQMREVHGFKPLENCNVDDYKNSLNTGGMTALFDAADNSILAATDYAKKLYDADFEINGITIIITDGEDNSSRTSLQTLKKSVENCTKSEAMKSMVSILVGVGLDRPDVSNYLQNIKTTAGITEYINVGDASPKNLAKLAKFVSKSISSQSSSLTGNNSLKI